MMRALIDIYEPHSYLEAFPEYVAEDMNPEGFWDLRKDSLTEPIPHEEGSVVKLWAPQYGNVDASKVKLVVWMQRRDIRQQVASILKCGEAEGFGQLPSHLIAKMFEDQYRGVYETYFKETPKVVVDMEDFRENPDHYLNQIKEIV
jgi:hypothetical protein